MKVNLSDVLTSEGNSTGWSMELTKDVPLEMVCFEKGSESFKIISKSPVKFTFSNIEKGKALVAGKVRLTLEAFCDRCLTEVPLDMELDFQRTVACSGAEDEEADDLGFMEDCQLDTETFVHNEIFVNWPEKILCRDDCRGLCLKCGQNLNEGKCGCDTFVPDPRMAVIQDIFNGNKEV